MEINGVVEVTNLQQNPPAKKIKFNMDFDDDSDPEDNLLLDEIDRWLNKPKEKDLKKFPTIKKMYVKFNTPLCSQASVERMFSLARLIFGLRRFALGDANFEKQLVVKANMVLNPKLFVKK